MAGLQRQPSRRDQFKLTGVKVLNDQIISCGPFTADIELEYVGLKCIGKKIHQALFMQGETAAKVRQLKEQCQLLSQLRHPNIAMFFGLFFQQTPILVMECVPYNLASCIEQHSILPNEVSYSILRDVALGLSYLHNQTPPIIHGELTAKQVMLTPHMMAKISYLGVPKILRLSQQDINQAALTSGTSVYMPPEIVTATCQIFAPDIDIYSCGILMVHTLAGKQPNSAADSETAERFPELTDREHPLMKLILQCTSTEFQLRPQADELVKELTEMAAKFPAKFAHRLDILKHIEGKKISSTDDDKGKIAMGKIQEKKQELLLQSQEIQRLTTENELLRKLIAVDGGLANKMIIHLQQLLTPP
jgi:serine/threonine protein kinase